MDKKFPKIFIFRLLAVLISIIFTILVLEILLRAFGPSYYKFNNKSSEYYTNPRGYHIPLRKEGDNTVYGLRYFLGKKNNRLPPPLFGENNTNINRPKNTILGLGDSFTFGQGVKYKDLYLSHLQTLLQNDQYDFGVKNSAMTDSDLEDIIQIYTFYSFEGKYPLVIYGFVLNDFGLPGLEQDLGFEFIDYNSPKYRYNRLRNISRVYNLICHIFDKKRLHNITLQIYLDAFKDNNAKEKFEMLAKLDSDIEKQGGKLIIVLFPLLYDFRNYPFQEIHDKISDFCNTEDILLLDLLPVYAQYNAEELWVNPTDHHPNEIAHRLTAEKLYELIKQNKLLKD